MVAPLYTCTTIEQRGVVRFLWEKNMEGKDIHKEMLSMYGEHCLSRQEIHNWVQKFSEGGQVSKTNIEPVGRWRSPRRKCSDSNQKNFTPQVSRDLWNGGTSV